MTTPDLAATLRDLLEADRRHTEAQRSLLTRRLAALETLTRTLASLTPYDLTVLTDVIRTLDQCAQAHGIGKA